MSDLRKPDEVIPPPTEGWKALDRRGELLALLPSLIRLMYRLLKDPRVPTRAKVLLGAAMAYGVAPIDLIPDSLPVVGALDDFFIVAIAIGKLLDRAGEEVVLEHWDGSADLLDLIESVLKTANDLIPKKIRKFLDTIG